MCTTSPTAFEVIDSSDLRTDDASAMGCLYAQGMHGPEVARELRAAFKAAQRAGAFPGVKVSITSSTYSMGSSVTVKVLAAPFAVVDRGRVARVLAGNRYARCRSARAELLLAQLKMLANLYRYDRSDAQSDYSDTNCFLTVDLDTSVGESAAWRETAAQVVAVGAAVVVGAVEASGALDDDRPALALEALARGDVHGVLDAASGAAEGEPSGDLAGMLVGVATYLQRHYFDAANPMSLAHVRAAGVRALTRCGWDAPAAEALYANAVALCA
jgi:hypothetical protein